MRLKHMGIETYVVYDTTSPQIGPGDLLIGHCVYSSTGFENMKTKNN